MYHNSTFCWNYAFFSPISSYKIVVLNEQVCYFRRHMLTKPREHLITFNLRIHCAYCIQATVIQFRINWMLETVTWTRRRERESEIKRNKTKLWEQLSFIANNRVAVKLKYLWQKEAHQDTLIECHLSIFHFFAHSHYLRIDSILFEWKYVPCTCWQYKYKWKWKWKWKEM